MLAYAQNSHEQGLKIEIHNLALQKCEPASSLHYTEKHKMY